MFCHRILPLINDKICCFYVDSFRLDRLREFSPAFLGDCPKLRMIQSDFPKFPADDSAGAAPAQALAKWLHMPRGDSLPKVLRSFYFHLERAEALKMAFVNSTNSVNFIICLYLWSAEIESNWLLVRCPIERDEDKWAKWEQEALVELDGYWKWNHFYINFNDWDIGDGMLDANAAPSEPKNE
uniref:Uncharacterized protein n=1 Tax=Globodera rostochiensis TaxID=31243 RepID=A0A914HBA0_GLORO